MAEKELFVITKAKDLRNLKASELLCMDGKGTAMHSAEHGTNLTGESPVTGICHQV